MDVLSGAGGFVAAAFDQAEQAVERALPADDEPCNSAEDRQLENEERPQQLAAPGQRTHGQYGGQRRDDQGE